MNRPAFALLAAALSLACRHAPNIHPQAVEHNDYGTKALAQGDLDKAQNRFELALEYNKDYAEAHNNLCLVWIRRGNLDKAKESCVRALRINNDLALAYNNLGYIHIQEESYGKAHDDFLSALKVNPGFLEARYNLCRTLQRLKESGKARTCYEKMIEVNSNIADPHHDLCVLDLEAGRFESAIQECGRAIELDPRYVGAYFNLGLAHQRAGRHCEAQEDYKSCVEADSGNAECRNNLASAVRHCALTDPKIAEARGEPSSESSAPGLFGLGMAELKKGLLPEAERHFQRCLKLDGRHGPCHCQLAELSQQQARGEEARDFCKKCLRYALDEPSAPQRQRCEKLLRSE